MKEEKVDLLIQETLNKETASTEIDKEQLWNAMQNRLDNIDQLHKKNKNVHSINRKTVKNQKKRTKKWFAITATIAGLFLTIFLTTTTEQGQALIMQVRQWLEPKKSINQELEGMPEKTEVNLHEKQNQSAKKADFIIYVDEERYHLIKNKDQFRITVELPEKYPEVYMDISQQAGTKPEEVIQKLKRELASKYKQVEEIEQTKNPVTGFRLRADQGNKKWNDEIVVYYVVSNKLNGSFIITQKYFLEASEGHGVRFDNMLKEFKILTNPKKPQK